MQPDIQNVPVSKTALWAGRVISALPTLFLLMDGVMKLFKPKFVVEATVQLGYSENVIVGLGIVLTACTLLYVIPQTAILGAVLLTGYLGGAVASHLRARRAVPGLLSHHGWRAGMGRPRPARQPAAQADPASPIEAFVVQARRGCGPCRHLSVLLARFRLYHMWHGQRTCG